MVRKPKFGVRRNWQATVGTLAVVVLLGAATRAEASAAGGFFPDPAFDSGWRALDHGWNDIAHPLGAVASDALIEIAYATDAGSYGMEIISPEASAYRVDRYDVEITASEDAEAVRVRMWAVDSWTTGADNLPRSFALPRLRAQSPSGGAGTIYFELPAASIVSLAAYDVRGALVQRFLGPLSLDTGTHEVDYDFARGAAVYFLQLIANEEIVTSKLVIVQ